MAAADSADAEAASTRRDVTFQFRECSVTLMPRTSWRGPTLPTTKSILCGVSGAVSSGGVLAIMGPSGAGKTTLLKLLSGLPGSAEESRSGVLTLNGAPLNAGIYQPFFAVVTQFDRNWTFLTCREHLNLAVAFHQARLTGEALDAEVTKLLELTGLVSCADLQSGTDVAEEMGPAGLSGGQRRRLSLSVALAKKPAVLIADEPTSGLDAAAAAAIMRLIDEQARHEHMAVACTIHQPSASVFAALGTLLLLTKGRTAYYGPASELLDYVASLGKPCPVGVSISEHALNLVNADFAAEAGVDQIIEEWHKRSVKLAPLAASPIASKLPLEPHRAAALRQCGLLFSRHCFMLLPRDPMTTVLICCLTLVDISIAGMYFWNGLRTHEQPVAFNKAMFVVIAVSLPTLHISLYCAVMAIERKRVQREMQNGMYSPYYYLLVTTAIQLPLGFVLGTFSMLTVYLWGDFGNWASFPYAWLVSGLVFFWFSSLGQLCGWLLGPTNGPLLYTAAFSFAFSARKPIATGPATRACSQPPLCATLAQVPPPHF